MTSAPVTNWQSVAMSGDGGKLAAVISGGPIYVSTNSGATWRVSDAPAVSWNALACSANGHLLVAAGGPIYTSTNWGENWELTSASNAYYMSAASSGNGGTLAAVHYCPSYMCDSAIYNSTNSGINWAQAAAPSYTPWRAVACSADGRQMIAAARGEYIASVGLIYKSTDYGANWLAANIAEHPWSSLSSSADGRTLAAAAWDGIWVSTNFGVDWICTTNLQSWNSIATSADGTKLVASKQGPLPNPSYTGFIYTSADSGFTWKPSGFVSNDFNLVASSADGNALVAAGGGIYTLHVTPTPVLDSAPAGNSLFLSWTIPSMNFVLQQAPDLTLGVWQSVAGKPILNYSNLQYQVSIPQPQRTMFYRLASQ